MSVFTSNTSSFLSVVPLATAVTTTEGKPAFTNDSIALFEEKDLDNKGVSASFMRTDPYGPMMVSLLVKLPHGSYLENRIKRMENDPEGISHLIDSSVQNAQFGGDHVNLTNATYRINSPQYWNSGVEIEIQLNIFIPETVGTLEDFDNKYLQPFINATR